MKYLLTVFAAFCLITFSFSSCGSKSDKDKNGTDQDSTRRVTPGTYCNEEYKFCIKYPADMMIPQGEFDGKGQEFLSTDSLCTLRVAVGNLDGTITRDNATIKDAYEKDIANENFDISYKAFNTTNYIIMGVVIGSKTVFYQKTILSNGEIVTGILKYESSVKDIYYPMIEPTFKSFK
ncbi:hypothetical protein D0T53_00250 [Dysgonomonas sp. 216]|uniref:hypothetical protein n=1 Tax=Dysgonomonas sp. 216 TaxID=2302934 RepID=UPI0013D064AE|nr:hypothetical protein [Dysgonomonas sp. 216]NDW17344.1 hypothetical protein [Dysgonomonas sp. 216]